MKLKIYHIDSLKKSLDPNIDFYNDYDFYYKINNDEYFSVFNNIKILNNIFGYQLKNHEIAYIFDILFIGKYKIYKKLNDGDYIEFADDDRTNILTECSYAELPNNPLGVASLGNKPYRSALGDKVPNGLKVGIGAQVLNVGYANTERSEINDYKLNIDKYKVNKKKKKVKDVKEWVFYFCDGGGITNYYHWFYDIYPKLWIYLLIKYKFGIIDLKLLCPSRWKNNKNFQMDSILYLNIKNKDILYHSSDNIYKKLIVSSSITDFKSRHTKSKNIFNFLYYKTLFLNLDKISKKIVDGDLVSKSKMSDNDSKLLINDYKNKKKKSKKIDDEFRFIYVSRKKSKHRILKNDDEVRNFLEKYGFRTIFFENYDLEEKIKIMNICKIMIMANGAGLVNLLLRKSHERFFIIILDSNVFPILKTRYQYILDKDGLPLRNNREKFLSKTPIMTYNSKYRNNFEYGFGNGIFFNYCSNMNKNRIDYKIFVKVLKKMNINLNDSELNYLKTILGESMDYHNLVNGNYFDLFYHYINKNKDIFIIRSCEMEVNNSNFGDRDWSWKFLGIRLLEEIVKYCMIKLKSL